MIPYIYLSYATENATEASRLSDTLSAYGFRVRCSDESTDQTTRARVLGGATQVIALTSPQAHAAETVAADLRRAPDRGYPPILVSLGENPLDERFCGETIPHGAGESRTAMECIPYPQGGSPDHNVPDRCTVELFIHRLLINRLSRVEGAFMPSRCRHDAYGRAVARAVAAHRGDPEAAYALGCAYERGEGLPILESEAAAWITRSADAGHPDALLHLGELCLCGWGVEPDESRAFALFTKAAEGSDVRAEYRLGLCYLNGVGVVPDPVRAYSYLRRAARWGYAPALYRLGLLCRDGIGTPPDAASALRHLYEACRIGAAEEADHLCEIAPLPPDEIFDRLYAEADAPDSDLSREDISLLRALSDLTDTGDPSRPLSVPPRTYPLPPSLYGSLAHASARVVSVSMRHLRLKHRKAALPAPSPSTSAGTSPARRLPTLSRVSVRRPEGAWIGGLTRSVSPANGGIRASAHPGIYPDRDDVAMGVPFDLSEAAVALAGLLDRGDGASLPPHPTRALVWYRYALRRGNTEALYRLADAYRRGRGTPRDPAWAVMLYRISADWGDVRGQFALGVACERGEGIRPDMVEAIRRYEQAAAVGYPPAQNNLGGCYEYGIGVLQNDLTAVEWYIHAANAGLPEAMCRLAVAYECGKGVPIDLSRAYDLYRQSADRGCAYALYRLGVFYDLGRYLLPEDQDSGIDLSTTPHPPLYAEAIRCWQAAAEAGVAEAAYALAMCYAHGHGVRRDLALAAERLRAAAKGGCLQAVYRLAMCRMEGVGVVKAPDRAIAELRAAVRLWHARRSVYLSNTASLPVCAYSPIEEAGSALYMLAYCLIEEIAPAAKDPAARRERIRSLLSEALSLGHVGAAIALGDLYKFGKLPPPDGMDAATAARHCHKQAVRMSAQRRTYPSPLSAEDKEGTLPDGIRLPPVSTPDPRADGLLSSEADALSVSSIPALHTLAESIIGKELGYARENEDPAWSETWRYFADAAGQGSADARVAMAKCTYYGHGQKQDPSATLRLLHMAEQASGGHVSASLFLGDFYRTGRCGPRLYAEADNAYLRGLSARPIDSEVGPYVITERKRMRLSPELQSRAELLYRLATFRAVNFSDHPADIPDGEHGPLLPQEDIDRRESFSYLAEAILLGHTAAQEDFARMYEYERKYPAVTTPVKEEQPLKKPRRLGRRKYPKATPAMRDHRAWLSDHYTALWPEPMPFTYRLTSAAAPSDLPAHIKEEVTPAMLASAMYYLGECYFEGLGLPRSRAAAVTCYRKVVEMEIPVPRGESPLPAVTWAAYSLGFCLLHGIGTRRDDREAVKWLSVAARFHAEASFCMGECHEQGIGVDKADPREAIKFYRRALKLGYTQAVGAVERIEAVLHDRTIT